MNKHFSPFKTLTAVGMLVVLGTGFAVPLSAQLPEIPAPPMVLIDSNSSVMMRAKLARSKTLLEGLLRQDFDSVLRAARELKRISETAHWPHPSDDGYDRFSREFYQHCVQLETLAKSRDHEGATSTYLNMTATCIKCHERVRELQRVAGLQRTQQAATESERR